MWRYVLADRSGASLGELLAYDRTLSGGISRTATAGCRIRGGNPLWQEAADADPMLKVYNDAGDLVFYGEVVSAEEAGQSGQHTIKLSAADISWRLSKRYVGQDPQGVGTTFTSVDSGTIIYTALATLNGQQTTGITAGNKDSFVARTVTYLWKRMLDVLSELGAIQGSYEWALRYTDGAPPTVFLDLPTVSGTDVRTDVYFEYGTGKANCSQYTRATARDQQATRVWALGQGSTQAPVAFDSGAEAVWGRLEDVVSYGDITTASLLDALAAAHVAIRAQPRVIVSVTPFPKTAPKYGTDWGFGDVVSARIVNGGVTRTDGVARIWSADIAIDELGNEQATLHLTPENS